MNYLYCNNSNNLLESEAEFKLKENKISMSAGLELCMQSRYSLHPEVSVGWFNIEMMLTFLE